MIEATITDGLCSYVRLPVAVTNRSLIEWVQCAQRFNEINGWAARSYNYQNGLSERWIREPGRNWIQVSTYATTGSSTPSYWWAL